MRVKDLVRWVDSFGLPSAPWAVEAADWATVLNLLSRLLHQQLAERVEMEEKSRRRRKRSEQMEEREKERNTDRSTQQREMEEEAKDEEEEGEGKEEAAEEGEGRRESTSSRHHPSTQLPFQQALHLAECALGAPQMTVLADTKTGAEVDNQLSLFVTLCSLRFAMGAAETKFFRDFQFPFRIYFDMDTDGSSRFCASCGELVHLIERMILEGRVWHRGCLKCAICGRQLYRGAFHCPTDGAMAFECVEHFANRVLYGDPKHRLAVQSSRHLFAPSVPEKRLSMLSIASSTATPPPRPPPPKAPTAATNQAQKQNEATEEESIEKKIASATAARHDAPTPKPRKTKPMALEKGEANSSKGTEKDTACCWEVLKYPEELNPFGSEDEADDDDGQKNPFGDSASSSGESELITSREGEKQRTKSIDGVEEEEEGEGEEPEEVPNPQDRVQTCSSAADEESSACPSPARAPPPPPMVQIVTAGGPSHAKTEENTYKEGKQSANTTAESENGTTPKTTETPAEIQTPNKAQPSTDEKDTQYQFHYIPPLAPMLFRGAGVQLRKFDVSRPLAPSAGDDKQYQQHQQQHLYELDTRLRKLHAQLDQWEITGARLEGQLLREMGHKEKMVWKKSGAKLANEYALVVERRLTALSLEAQLVRRYMGTFLELAHAELDAQMKAAERVAVSLCDNRRPLFGSLLAQLLHMRNELTELERLERSGRTNAAAEESERKRETEKTTKREAKREKEEKMEETDKRGAEEKKNSADETAEKVPTEQQQKKRTMLKMRGVKQSLVNTLRKKL